MSDLPKPMPPPSAPMMNDGVDHDHGLEASASYRNELLRQGYTPGLISAIQKNRIAFAHCFWIIDNSGSMQTQDGHRIITTTTATTSTKTTNSNNCNL
jgi:hypothetical protein